MARIKSRSRAAGYGLLITAVVAGGLFWLRPPPSGDLGTGPGWVRRITAETRAQRPDILFVVYDARRRDDFSFGRFGNERGDTPFLSQFKERSAFFEDAISPGCWTVPVHASMFSGLSVCELGNDFYNPALASFPSHFLSLAEILRIAGYRTIAYPDHPYFYNEWTPEGRQVVARETRSSLVRGFDLFNVVNDFSKYGSYTNIGTKSSRIEQLYRLTGMPALTPDEVRAQIDRFNRGETRIDLEREADYDAENDLYLPHLYPLFRESPYFEKRYGSEFDAFAFAGNPHPYFLFVNLHMCATAAPDPGLLQQWLLKTLMFNARRRGTTLVMAPRARDASQILRRNMNRLDLGHGRFWSAEAFLKHVFDNRFYDASFRAVWEYLDRRGLTQNLVTVVTSDHGLSLGERGEAVYVHGGARPNEYMVQVPLVVRFPKDSALARLHGRYADKVSLTDVFPTLVDLGLGDGVFERTLPVRGRSLVKRLQNRDYDEVLVAESALRALSYGERPGVVGYSKAVYWRSMKLIHAPAVWRLNGRPLSEMLRLGEPWSEEPPSPAPEKQKTPFTFLYDLSEDPHEGHNLADRDPALVDKLQRLVGTAWACQPYPGEVGRPSWDNDALETLRSLGYVQ